MKEYHEILRELREDHDFTQSRVAKVLGITQQVYSRYELGINKMPVRRLRTLCQFYQVSAGYALTLDPAKKRLPIWVCLIKNDAQNPKISGSHRKIKPM